TGNDGLPVGRREVTVLFADLMGFSAMSERLAPEVLVRVLSTHFQRMSEIVAYHRGHVAKFIGDGMMALFGAFEHNPWQGNDAAHGALEMLGAVDEHSVALAEAGMPRLRMGIGNTPGRGGGGRRRQRRAAGVHGDRCDGQSRRPDRAPHTGAR